MEQSLSQYTTLLSPESRRYTLGTGYECIVGFEVFTAVVMKISYSGM
jgi:hypothetical protein